jgi:REP element-mobilizing transposase RayT
MRNDARAAVIRQAFVAGCKKDGFRIIDWSIQSDHLHLVVEARDKLSLTRGMQGFCVRVARRLNAHLGRTGTVFAERYSARELKSPREARNCRAYVMNNARRHNAQRGLEWEDGTVDLYSSWAWFDGWRDCPRELVKKARAGPEAERPVAEAHTWLLREGWRRHGLVTVDEIPGLRRSSWRVRPGEEPDWSWLDTLIDSEKKREA